MSFALNRRLLCAGLFCFPLLTMTGCGGGANVEVYEKYFRELIRSIDAMAAEFDSIKNPEMAIAKNEALVRMSNDLSMKLGEAERLPKVGMAGGAALKSRFQQEWQGELEASLDKLRAAVDQYEKRFRGNPKLGRISQRFKNLDKQIDEFKKGYEAQLGE